MKEYAERFYKSIAWKECRAAFISKRRAADGGLCQRCGRRVGYIVHHRIELTPRNIGDADIAFGHGNLEYLCLECHNREHGVFAPAEHRVEFDENGDVVGSKNFDPPGSPRKISAE